MLFLTNELTLLQFEIVFTGGISSCSVCVREVLRLALKYGASQLIIAHNHPNTTAVPSKSDLELTTSLATACKLVDMVLLDHIIVGIDGTKSLQEMGEF